MNILLTGGFLGSGKTTLLSKLTSLLLQQGKRICIVENEIGQNAVDDLLLRTGSVDISTITGGCICCQISGSLIEALREMDQTSHPDWVLIELTGTAFANAVVDNLRMYLPGNHTLVVMAVADSARWPVLLKAAKPMICQQLQGAGIVVANKIECASNPEAIMEQIRQLVPGCKVLPMNALEDSGEELLNLLETEAVAL